MTPDRWARIAFWALLSAGVLDRCASIQGFGALYSSTDDVLIWSAAVDYGNGIFHEPYFYGQDYGPMLEALVAAPFAKAGASLRVLMPSVSTVLAMLPYWSFAFWHWRRKERVPACAFLAIPLFLPVEYNMITTMTRGWVTGMGPLALFPWALDIRKPSLRSMLVGCIASVACLMNPNALPFTAAFVIRYMAQQRSLLPTMAWMALGTLPGVTAQALAQAYCRAHPERVIHVLHDWRMVFHPEGIQEALTRLDAHFVWLTPVAWPYGQVIGEALVILACIAFWKRSYALALGLAGATAVIILSFGFAKTHDGAVDVFFPLSRMFLTLPLIVAWALAHLSEKTHMRSVAAGGAVVAACGVLLIKWLLLPSVVAEQVANQGPWVSARPLATLTDDFAHVRKVCADHRVGLIVPLFSPAEIASPYRALMYPALDTDLPPTYIPGHDNRYWPREAYSRTVVPDVLLIAGKNGSWAHRARSLGTTIDVSGDRPDRFLLLRGNTLETDSLANYLLAP